MEYLECECDFVYLVSPWTENEGLLVRVAKMDF